jgi:hypothetical protein
MDQSSSLLRNRTVNEPSDFQQISGFYGPGAWSAIVLAGSSSWYSIRYRPETGSILTTISPILYINWAAIDLLRHPPKIDPPSGPTVAAFAVTYWGLMYLNLQHQHVSVRVSPNSSNHHGALQRTQLLFQVARVLPILALMLYVYCVDVGLAALVANGTESLGTTKITDALKKTRLSDCLAIVFTVVGLFATLCSIGMALLFGNRHPLLRVIASGISGTGTMLLLGWPFYSLFRWNLSMPDVRLPCFVQPCAPQSWTDWDQAFALLCGIGVLVYEVGPDVWRLGRWIARNCFVD